MLLLGTMWVKLTSVELKWMKETKLAKVQDLNIFSKLTVFHENTPFPEKCWSNSKYMWKTFIWWKQQPCQACSGAAWICGADEERHEHSVESIREALGRLRWSCKGSHEKWELGLFKAMPDTREAVARCDLLSTHPPVNFTETHQVSLGRFGAQKEFFYIQLIDSKLSMFFAFSGVLMHLAS